MRKEEKAQDSDNGYEDIFEICEGRNNRLGWMVYSVGQRKEEFKDTFENVCQSDWKETEKETENIAEIKKLKFFMSQ